MATSKPITAEQGKKLFKQFTTRYSIALTIIAVLSVLSQIRIQQHLSRSIDDSHVINFAARLRTYSQTLSKTALLLEDNYDFENNRKEFLNTLRQWEKAQEGLEAGSKFLNLPADNMDEIKQMLDLTDHPRIEIMNAAEHILSITDSAKPFRPELIKPYVQTILDYEQSYLLGMELVVFDYDRFSKDRIAQLKQTDYIVLVLVILTLLIEASFIFYPLALHIKKVVTGLVESEKKATLLSQQLKTMHEQTEQSYNELREINYALERSTFLLKTDAGANILYANDRFCLLSKYPMSELLNHSLFLFVHNRSPIEEYFRKGERNTEYWQGEVIFADSDKEEFWLDITIMPVFDKGGSLYRYLVIGSDITDRKNAERENRLLTEEKIKRQGIEQKMVSYAIINGQEKERKRIAAEVHDGIGQMLTTLRMKLERISDDYPRMEELGKTNEMVSSLVTETRRICSDLLPSVLEDFGLGPAVGDLVKTCRESADNIKFILEERLNDYPLSRELEISIYRIVQEAINNAIKHSDATLVEIHLYINDNTLALLIRDNGKGFYLNGGQFSNLGDHSKKMNGIRGMKERAELLNGIFNIAAEPGKGTILQLDVPLQL